jgi:hypothetical protein
MGTRFPVTRHNKQSDDSELAKLPETLANKSLDGRASMGETPP